MTRDETGRLLARAAARAEGEPFFMASALAAYRALNDLDEDALAAALGCDRPALARLGLCRRPGGEGPMFREEVERIAAYAGCDAARLAAVLRAASPASLLAARDRAEEAGPTEPAADEPKGGPEGRE